VVQIQHVRARSKGPSAGIVLSSKFMVTYTRVLLLNPAKNSFFIIGYDDPLYRSEILC
jgi:hypothetical protein